MQVARRTNIPVVSNRNAFGLEEVPHVTSSDATFHIRSRRLPRGVRTDAERNSKTIIMTTYHMCVQHEASS